MILEKSPSLVKNEYISLFGGSELEILECLQWMCVHACVHNAVDYKICSA